MDPWTSIGAILDENFGGRIKITKTLELISDSKILTSIKRNVKKIFENLLKAFKNLFHNRTQADDYIDSACLTQQQWLT